jgi:hypothetical protein
VTENALDRFIVDPERVQIRREAAAERMPTVPGRPRGVAL